MTKKERAKNEPLCLHFGLISKTMAAEMLGMSLCNLMYHIKAGNLPAPTRPIKYRNAKRKYYNKRDLDQLIAIWDAKNEE